MAKVAGGNTGEGFARTLTRTFPGLRGLGGRGEIIPCACKGGDRFTQGFSKKKE